MRISDWSSDVCSSDLRVRVLIFDHLSHRAVGVGEDAAIGGGIGGAKAEHRDPRPRYERAAQPAHRVRAQHRAIAEADEDDAIEIGERGPSLPGGVSGAALRSEERRGGEECVRRCRYRLSPYP